MGKTKRLRWGILGTARINRALIEPIKASKNSSLSAVASRTLEKAAEYAKVWDIPHFYPSYDALLNDPEIDVIYNSLPNALHAEWSIKSMRMGKHVLCEKPLTTSMEDLDAVISTSRETGMVISEAFMYRHHSQTLKVKQIIEDGKIGEPQIIRGSFCYTNTRQFDTRFDLNLGGGCLWDVGCYPISYARFLIGKEPIEVYGHQVTGPTGIDLLFAGQMTFPKDIIAQFDASFISPYKAIMEITCDKGKLTIPSPYKPQEKETILLETDGKIHRINVKGKELYSGEVEDIEQAILHGKPARISLEESRGNLSTILALYKSAQLSETIHL